MAQIVKTLSEMQKTQLQSLGWEVPWRRKWLPTPVFLPGESYGQRRLVGCSPWDCKSRTRLVAICLSYQHSPVQRSSPPQFCPASSFDTLGGEGASYSQLRCLPIHDCFPLAFRTPPWDLSSNPPCPLLHVCLLCPVEPDTYLTHMSLPFP